MVLNEAVRCVNMHAILKDILANPQYYVDSESQTMKTVEAKVKELSDIINSMYRMIIQQNLNSMSIAEYKKLSRIDRLFANIFSSHFWDKGKTYGRTITKHLELLDSQIYINGLLKVCYQGRTSFLQKLIAIKPPLKNSQKLLGSYNTIVEQCSTIIMKLNVLRNRIIWGDSEKR